MELKQLEAYIQVVKLNSFSRAAEMLYMSQPTISAQIRALEKELGAQLLIRTTKEVYPTKLGKEFCGYAQDILAMRDKAAGIFRQQGNALAGDLNILASTVPGQYLLPDLIAALRRDHPGILCRIQLADSRLVVEGLTECQWDFGLTGTKVGESNKLKYEPVYEDKLVLIMPKHTSLPKKIDRDTFIRLLEGYPFVMREPGSGTRTELENILGKYGLMENQITEAAVFNNTQSIINGVAAGLGISIVSAVAARAYSESGLIKTCEIDSTVLNRNIYLVFRKDMLLSPLQQCFAEYLRNFFRESGDGHREIKKAQ